MSEITVTPAGGAENEDRWAHARALGRLTEPPEAGGHWRLRTPLTRDPVQHLISAVEFYVALEVVAGAAAYRLDRPPADSELGAADVPLPGRRACGYARPGWRLRWPLRHVPAGMRLMADADYTRQERALVDGIGSGLLDARSAGEDPGIPQ